MKKNRRILPILLCAAMAVSVMTGCKAKTEETAKAAEGAKTGQSEAAGTEGTGEKAPAGEVSKIAILLPGFITDKSWNQGAYEGLKDMESHTQKTYRPLTWSRLSGATVRRTMIL